MVPLGAACLIAAPFACLYAAGAALLGARRHDRRLVDSSRRAVYALCALLTVCVVVLEAAFLRSDFSVELVADHSSTTTPTFYKLTAMWSSQGGSLLLWAWVLSIAASAVLYLTRRRHREVVPYATAVLAGLGLFFAALMLFADGANPFARLDPAPAEGVGLNPLLRHPAMAVHPPMLYSGYVFFSIPFAFAIGALISRRLDASWIRTTRRFALVAWIFLGIGILLGARWSYAELGWGGYWGWDAVENASLMPWLLGTAFLHSVMVQERRGMLKVWNVSLIVATFTLALLGTFLVRSGILESIHAFGASTVGGPLLGLIAIVVIGSAALIVSRLDDLRSARRIESLASRESVFLVNNLLLVGLCLVIFWGTFFPLISEAITGERSSLGSPWFDRYTAPLAILLVLFTGIGPLLAWRRVSAGSLWRLLRGPLAAAALATIAVAVLTDALSEPLAAVLFGFAAFALAALAAEFWRGAAAQRALAGGGRLAALGRVVSRNRRRYGGYTVHAGFALAMIAVAASSSFQTSVDLRLLPGESGEVGDYTVTYVEPTSSIDDQEQRLTLGAVLDVERGGEQFALLHPSRNFYSSVGAEGTVRGFFEGEATSEVGRRESPGGDLWTAMRPDLTGYDAFIDGADRRIERAAGDAGPEAPFLSDLRSSLQGVAVAALAERYRSEPVPVDIRVNVNPLVIWIWVGGAIAIVGALIAVWPAPEARRRRVSDVYAARLARDLERV
ncbi:MAG: cytochrome c assembly protein [Solirubrobacterales bacterium]|jgi:cytochrome c-type biogenesis protein CcmF|nr:cytochrome c assembly protein [Solirubrobacterales bacterium]